MFRIKYFENHSDCDALDLKPTGCIGPMDLAAARSHLENRDFGLEDEVLDLYRNPLTDQYAMVEAVNH